MTQYTQYTLRNARVCRMLIGAYVPTFRLIQCLFFPLRLLLRLSLPPSCSWSYYHSYDAHRALVFGVFGCFFGVIFAFRHKLEAPRGHVGRFLWYGEQPANAFLLFLPYFCRNFCLFQTHFLFLRPTHKHPRRSLLCTHACMHAPAGCCIVRALSLLSLSLSLSLGFDCNRCAIVGMVVLMGPCACVVMCGHVWRMLMLIGARTPM